jgi:uncharacterized Tic20 family protein
MTEPPRPTGEDSSGPTPDPTSPPPPPPASTPTPGEAPASGYAPPPPAAPQYDAPSYDSPPPSSAPPGGTYPPAGGYPPAGYPAGPAPAGYANSEEKTWALVAHFGGAAGMFIGGGLLGWVPPLIALLAKGNQSPTVRAHAVSALNFQLLWSIIALVGYILLCVAIGFVIFLAAMVIGIVFGIIAGIRANEGQVYRYPMSVNIIK